MQKLLQNVSESEAKRVKALKDMFDDVLKQAPEYLILATMDTESQTTAVRIIDPIDGGLETLGLARMVEQATFEYLFRGGKQQQQDTDEDVDE